jgi:hypothetical protein
LSSGHIENIYGISFLGQKSKSYACSTAGSKLPYPCITVARS